MKKYIFTISIKAITPEEALAMAKYALEHGLYEVVEAEED